MEPRVLDNHRRDVVVLHGALSELLDRREQRLKQRLG